MDKANDELRPIISNKHYFLRKNIVINDRSISAIGIDFGTTSCRAAVNRTNGLEAIALDNTGQKFLPSYVAFDEKHAKVGNLLLID